MNLTKYTGIICFASMLLISCVTTQPTPGPTTPAPGAADYKLTGHYHKDKYYFFPNGRNFEKEKLYLKALHEGAEGEIYKPSDMFGAEQNLAIEYDAISFVAINSDEGTWEYGIVLGKVGRWKEAVDALTKVVNSNPASGGIWGNLGVAHHALGNYKESVSSFEKAVTIDPSYFDSRPNQIKIWLASKGGLTVTL